MNQPGFGAGLYPTAVRAEQPGAGGDTAAQFAGHAIQRYLADVVAVQSLNVTADNERVAGASELRPAPDRARSPRRRSNSRREVPEPMSETSTPEIGAPEMRTRDNRRTLLLASRLNGLDEVEVMDDRRTLLVRFFHDAPEGLGATHLRITGGVAVRHIHVLDVVPVGSHDPDIPALVKVTLDRTGDASIYQLHVAGIDGIDQRYTNAPFVFFPEADDGLDCSGAAASPPPSSATAPHINYLAKDYAGFRQVMLDRLAVTLPAWQETHIPDFGIMLVELLAYVADRLSYYQDAVATEAYLEHRAPAHLGPATMSD